MNPMRFVESGNLPSGIIREVKNAVKTYYRGFYSASFKEVLTAPAKREVIDKIRRGDTVSDAEVQDVIIGFLNQWRCRLSKNRSAALRKALLDIAGQLRKLPRQLERLERSDLVTIEKMFNRLCEVKGVGATASSKTLALLRPALFVMWDEAIAGKYGFARNGTGYCRFLLTMRDVARRLRELHGSKRPALEEHLKPEGREWTPPLAKYLDEWNWVRLVRGR